MDSLYTIYFAALGVMLAVNALLAFRFRSTLPILYSGALIAVAAIALLSGDTGGGGVSPTFPDDLRTRLIGLAGSWAALCAVFFWDRLLLLEVHAPRARRTVFAAGIGVAVAGGAMLIPGVVPSRVETTQQILSLALLPTMAWTATLALRAGFRPAIYSTIGVLFFLAMAVGHVAQSRGWFAELPAAPFSNQLLLIGFLGEFVWFVLSLAGRATVLGNPHDAVSEHEGIRNYEEDFARRKYERSTLIRVDTDRLRERLDRLMRVERVYCDEDLSLDRLATLCEINRHELSEFLNHRLGANFNRYVNDFRVREAQERLQEEPGRTILDIAYSCGFNSKTRFNTEFKRVTRLTPRQFRKRTDSNRPAE
ncbi:MAG: helix-turn-helix domain-containing protein [Leptospirales bacterium]|jgi:AraC-like DNA-binding protein